MYREINGNLITLGQQNTFDVIAHGVNCFCIQGAGLAPQMVDAFSTDKFPMEAKPFIGEINKLGTVEYRWIDLQTGEHFAKPDKNHTLCVVNAYTQFDLGRNHKAGKPIPVDYEALALCMRKMNYLFKGMKVGLPQIGAGLAGGDWKRIKKIIQEELVDCDVTVVIYDNSKILTNETQGNNYSQSI